ncbi:hypothetical protein [Pseudorhodoplanes sp.]|uniref:hypothetical protein n=1 Tax=Pseudorhodoplanes sp. TaxID=1934341 RepID=UPI003D0CE8A0
MREQDDEPLGSTCFVLSDDAPRNAVELLQRLAVTEPGIKAERARQLLEHVGINVSPALASMVISEAKRLIRFLKEADLVCDDFAQKRRGAADDIYPARRDPDSVEVKRHNRIRDRNRRRLRDR